MPSSSRVGAAQDAILTLLQADATLSALAGPPQFGEPQNPADEHVWVAEEFEVTQDVHTTGNTPTRQEDFAIMVKVFVVQTGNAPVAVRDRALFLASKVEDIVRVNFTLASSVFFGDVLMLHGFTGAWDKRRGQLIEIPIRCRSYI